MIRALILFALLGGVGFASTLTLDTAPLETSGTGPFSIDFQFVQGDGAVNNTVSLSNFSFGGGSLNQTPTSTSGNVSVGTGPFSVTLDDTGSFYNDVQFAFTPGNSLSFDFSSTSNSEPTTPDTFTFAIFDGSGNEIPTTNPNYFDSFLELDLPAGGSPSATILSGSSGYAVNIAPPIVSNGNSGGPVIPEPATLPLVGMTALMLIGLRLKRCA